MADNPDAGLGPLQHWAGLISGINKGKTVAGQTAIHKPLLTLLLLARAQSGGSRRVPFHEIDAPLQALLVRFAPPAQRPDPTLPFWHLQHDGFWTIPGGDRLPPRRDRPDRPLRSAIAGATGEVPELLWKQLVGASALIPALADHVVSEHLDPSRREEILAAAGIRRDEAKCGNHGHARGTER